MGQKANPIANRLGYIHGWKANWYAKSKNFADTLYEDYQIRTLLHKKFRYIIAEIFIERTADMITVFVNSLKPGMIIGSGGEGIHAIKKEIRKRIGKTIAINVNPVKVPELNATLIAKNIAEQIEKRISYKRAINRALEDAIYLGAQGIKIHVSGRLGGIEIARSVKFLKGRVPTQTLRADIDFVKENAFTQYGVIGIKVWLFKKEVYGKRDLSLVFSSKEPRAKKKKPFSPKKQV